MNKSIKIAYFGGEPIGVPVVTELAACGIVPELVVCNPDRKSGRGQQLTAPPIKTWAEERHIEVWQPTDLKDELSITERLQDYDLFIVVAYNRILPKWLIELPKHKTINVHPSLLPALRGPSPIRTAILENRRQDIGVSIMLMDEKMDHGPILAQLPVLIADEQWPIDGNALDTALANTGGALLADTITKYLHGEITPQEQDHDAATYTNKLTKEMGELVINPHDLPTAEAATEALHKIRGLAGWPGAYFFYSGKRIKIKTAEVAAGQLRCLKIVPEGKSEIDFTDWLQTLKR